MDKKVGLPALLAALPHALDFMSRRSSRSFAANRTGNGLLMVALYMGLRFVGGAGKSTRLGLEGP